MYKYKKILSLTALFTALISIFSLSIVSYADSYDWYIKRGGNKTPSFPQGAEELGQYDCFYIDKKAVVDEEKVIYLTFDAGYENGNIKKILDVLSKNDVSAAFFVLDNLIYKNPDLIRRMAEDGHLICNHTKNHKDLSEASKEQIKEDLGALEEICQSVSGVEMSKFFRFPRGKYSREALAHLNELGYKTVFWSFAYEDWDNEKQPGEVAAIKKILENTHNGEIILLHPTSETNAKIMQRVITAWKCMGYRFGTLDELAARNSV